MTVGVAHAQTSTYLVGSGGLESFNLQMDGDSADYVNSLAGDMTFTHESGPGASFSTVCTDVAATLYIGGTYTYNQPVSFAGQTGLDPVWGAFVSGSPNSANEVAAIQAAADVFYKYSSVFSGSLGGLQGSDLDQKAGLQLAVWTALYDTSVNAGVTSISSFTSGSSRFQVLGLGNLSAPGWNVSAGTVAAENDAVTMLGAVNFSDLYSGNLLVPNAAAQNGGYFNEPTVTAQEVLINVTPVPEPTTLIAGGLLLLPFAGSALRFRRSAS
jgi:hypothetical protein